ncbi:Wound-responsive family protein [Quillaja saponaria]|uniref:Wound-responsive family protein n=1 Tax=Quillaja saponaria TaxID=32244 RepID=A0AAD7PAN1_QUISA|nr:Wound-responsive family protein [Quillaja saponaria]
MSAAAATRAWVVAASIGAVEALKDQLGVCRWNYAMRSLQQHAKNNIRSYSQAKKLSAPSSAAINQVKRSKEESMKKVMDLSCWGPNTTRF